MDDEKQKIINQVDANGSILGDLDDKWKSDKEVVLAAVKSDGFALEYADPSLKKDKEVVLTAVKSDGSALRYADASLKKDKEIVLTAIKQDASALQDADKKLRADKEVVLIAVKQRGDVLQYANTSLKKDKEVVNVAIKQSGDSLQYADSSFKKDKDIFKTSEEIYKNFIKSENLKGKKLTKISVYFNRISERETVSGTFFFEDGTSKEGSAYNNNVLSGTIDFSNNEGSVPLKEFIQRLKDNEWTQYIGDFIDNFEGTGKSIDYNEGEFESFEEGDSDGCEWDAKQDPSAIYFYFGDKEVTFDSSGSSYVNKNISYTKENIADLVISLTES